MGEPRDEKLVGTRHGRETADPRLGSGKEKSLDVDEVVVNDSEPASLDARSAVDVDVDVDADDVAMMALVHSAVRSASMCDCGPHNTCRESNCRHIAPERRRHRYALVCPRNGSDDGTRGEEDEEDDVVLVNEVDVEVRVADEDDVDVDSEYDDVDAEDVEDASEQFDVSRLVGATEGSARRMRSARLDAMFALSTSRSL